MAGERVRRNTSIILAILIAIIFVVPPIVPVGWPSGTYQSSFQYDCPPGDNLTQGLPLPVYTMSVSYAVFKVGFIYDEQLKPPLAFEASSTIHLPCNR